MKKIIVLLCLLIATPCFAQTWDETGEKYDRDFGNLYKENESMKKLKETMERFRQEREARESRELQEQQIYEQRKQHEELMMELERIRMRNGPFINP